MHSNITSTNIYLRLHLVQLKKNYEKCFTALQVFGWTEKHG